MASPQFDLLKLPLDIRRLIYESYYPVAKHIKLTSGPVSEKMTHEDFTICRLPFEAINLMRVCRQINDEITAILYATNTFSMVPSESLTLHLDQVSLRWLHDLRSSTKRMVKKLDIRVELPMNRSYITELISGVSLFPTLEIRVVQHLLELKEERMTINFEESMNNLTEICKGVMKARGSAQTTWNDMGHGMTKMDFLHLNIIGTIDEILKKGHDTCLWTVSGDEWTQRETSWLSFSFRHSTPYE